MDILVTIFGFHMGIGMNSTVLYAMMGTGDFYFDRLR